MTELKIKNGDVYKRQLYKVNTSTEDALRRIEEQVPFSPEIAHLIEFRCV